jgi:hypothetical protein
MLFFGEEVEVGGAEWRLQVVMKGSRDWESVRDCFERHGSCESSNSLFFWQRNGTSVIRMFQSRKQSALLCSSWRSRITLYPRDSIMLIIQCQEALRCVLQCFELFIRLQATANRMVASSTYLVVESRRLAVSVCSCLSIRQVEATKFDLSLHTSSYYLSCNYKGSFQ